MNPQKQVDFIHRAIRALGYSDHTTTSVADAIELSYREGLEAGFRQGSENCEAAYQTGYADAQDAMQGDEQPEGAWDDFIEDERYEAGC